MAATVLDGYSVELAQIQPPNYAPLQPNKYEGRIRVSHFTKTFASESAGLDLGLVILPKGARILGGGAWISASSGSATISFGLMDPLGTGYIDKALSVSDGTAYLKALAAMTATTVYPLADGTALYYGYECEKQLYVTLTTAAAAMGTQTMKGHIIYAVD